MALQEFKMSDEQLAALLDACKPTPAMFLSGGRPMFDSPQENANRAWATLGKEMGFNPMSVRPAYDKGQQYFLAEPVTP